MAYDFKKEQRTMYRPGEQLVVVDVPAMTFLTVRGHGDPNQPGSEYQQSIQLLYGLAYTIKMSKKGSTGWTTSRRKSWRSFSASVFLIT